LETRHIDISEEELLKLLKEEKTADEGLRLLIDKYGRQLYWIIRRIVLDHDDANDVLQNCLIKVYHKIHTFEGRSKLITWLQRIATNEAIDFYKARKRRRSTSIDDETSFVGQRLKADAWFDGNEAQVLLHQAIATLPDKQKQVFLLRYFEEMPYAEMSAMLGTSEGALKASFHHAVKKIEAFVQAAKA
jgi:RNA polymerase sigma-70 factor (ECF subfamily)